MKYLVPSFVHEFHKKTGLIPHPFIWNRYSLKVSIIKYLRNFVFVVKKELKIRNVINSNLLRILKVLGAGLEPARPLWPLDFKSNVSTNSTIRANYRAKDGIWTRDPHLGKVMLYQLSYFRRVCKCIIILIKGATNINLQFQS